jgi:hypothetical protein
MSPKRFPVLGSNRNTKVQTSNNRDMNPNQLIVQLQAADSGFRQDHGGLEKKGSN